MRILIKMHAIQKEHQELSNFLLQNVCDTIYFITIHFCLASIFGRQHQQRAILNHRETDVILSFYCSLSFGRCVASLALRLQKKKAINKKKNAGFPVPKQEEMLTNGIHFFHSPSQYNALTDCQQKIFICPIDQTENVDKKCHKQQNDGYDKTKPFAAQINRFYILCATMNDRTPSL